MNIVKLSMTEARSTDGVLCWAADRSGWRTSNACSLLRAHGGEHRYDMDIRPDPMPLARFLRVAGVGVVAGGIVVGLFAVLLTVLG